MKRTISFILAVAMTLTVLMITPISGSAVGSRESDGYSPVGALGTASVTVEDRSGATQTREYKIGDEFTVISYLKVPDGKRVNSINIWQSFNAYDEVVELLSDVDELDDDENYVMFPNMGSCTAALDGNIIKSNASAAKYTRSLKFPTEDSVLIQARYRVISAGETTIKTDIITLATIVSDNTQTVQIAKSAKVGSDQIITRTEFDGEYIAPTEAPTQAPTEKPTQQSTTAPTERPTTSSNIGEITIEDWNGTTDTRRYKVGDEFTVISYLKVPDGKRVNSINIWQSFNAYDEVVELLSDVDEVDDDDNYVMFPNFDPTGNVDGNIIKVNASAAKYGRAFRFPTEDTVLIKARYKVVSAGQTTIKTDIITLATIISDNTQTVQIAKSAKVGSDQIITRTEFDCAYIAPTEAPTQAPTEKPTQKPTRSPTERPTAPPTTPSNTARITIQDWNGTTQTREYKIGDEFTVISYLKVPDGKRVNSINIWQSFNAYGEVVELLSDVDEVDDDDNYVMFPNLDPTGNVDGNIIKVNASAAKYGRAFRFPTEDTVLIKARYKVVSAGQTTIKTDIITLATIISDNSEAVQISKSAKVGSDAIITRTVFDGSYQPATEAPTQQPTQKPTAATEATVYLPTDGVVIVADGLAYKLSKGDRFTYVKCFNNGEKICSLDAATFYDSTGLSWIEPTDEYGDTDYSAMFPILGYSVVFDHKNSALYYNYSSAKGKTFNSNLSRIVAYDFEITAESGVYEINTFIYTLAGADEKLYINHCETVSGYLSSITLLCDMNGAELEQSEIQSPSESPTEPQTEPQDEPQTEPSTAVPTEEPDYPTESTVPAETKPTYSTSSHTVYFDASGSPFSTYDNIMLYCYCEEDGDVIIDWGSRKRGGMTYIGNGIWAFDFDSKGLWLDPYKQYILIFNGDNIIQTHQLLFDTSRFGDTAYCDGDTVENWADSNRFSYVCRWRSGNLGPEKLVTSIGNVIGEIIPDYTSAYNMFVDFIRNTLNNARHYSGKTDQQIIDDVAEALGLDDSDVQRAIDYSGVNVDWRPAATQPPEDEYGFIVGEYYLLGSINGDNSWTAKPHNSLRFVMREGMDQMILESVTLKAGDRVKAARYNGNKSFTWYPDGIGSEISVTATGRYDFYFKPYEVGNPNYWYLTPNLNESVILGDVDGDGVVTIIDATIIQRALADFEVPIYIEDAADVNGNGVAEITDVTPIQYYIADFPVEFPIGQRK